MNSNANRLNAWAGDRPSAVSGGYFERVRALPDYRLAVTMKTDSVILFDFRPRLDTARFGTLRDTELFESVKTDGDYLVFYKAGMMPVKIGASEFMDIVLVDRRH